MNVTKSLSRKTLFTLPITLLIALSITVAEAAQPTMDDQTLARWKASYDELRDMTPKWGKQGVEAFKTSLDVGVPILMLDVRTPKEWQKGIVEGALMIELNQLPTRESLAKLPIDRDTIIGVYCKAAHRSTLALILLHQLGYKNAIDMVGGYKAWEAAGYPIETVSE